MFPGSNSIPDGLGLRPVRSSDAGFLEALHRSTRDDLRLIDADNDTIETIIEMQQRAQTQGYGEQFPDAMQLIVEKLGERIGRVVLSLGQTEVRVVDIAFIPAARGKGYGATLIRQFQTAATLTRAPLVLSVLRSNPRAIQFYASLGFMVEQQDSLRYLMVWHPA